MNKSRLMMSLWSLMVVSLWVGCTDEEKKDVAGDAAAAGADSSPADPLAGTWDAIFTGGPAGGSQDQVQGSFVLKISAAHTVEARVYTASGELTYKDKQLKGTAGTYTADIALKVTAKDAATLSATADIMGLKVTCDGTFSKVAGAMKASGTWTAKGTAQGKPVDLSGTWRAVPRLTDAKAMAQAATTCQKVAKVCKDGPTPTQCMDTGYCAVSLGSEACRTLMGQFLGCWVDVKNDTDCQACLTKFEQQGKSTCADVVPCFSGK